MKLDVSKVTPGTLFQLELSCTLGFAFRAMLQYVARSDSLRQIWISAAYQNPPSLTGWGFGCSPYIRATQASSLALRGVVSLNTLSPLCLT